MKVKKTKFDGVYKIDNKLATINLVPGEKVYGEQLVKIGNIEYRIWDEFRSKPAAAIKNGLENFPIKEGSKILYLGIASGTTASHFSDIIKNGIIYGIEISEIPLKDLILIAEKRKNIVPILADARKIEQYEHLVEKVDVVYCDIAQPDEVRVFLENCKKFLKEKGYGMIAIKSRSIDVTKNPNEIYKQAKKEIEEYYEVLEIVKLDPYQKDHAILVCKA